MSNKIVLDASAVITLLAKENGFEIVKQHLKNAVISSVNVAEIYKYCMDKQQLTESDCKNTIFDSLDILRDKFAQFVRNSTPDIIKSI